MKLLTKLVIIMDVVIAGCFALVYGPIDKARVFWITTAMETANHQYLANIFYSEDTIKQVMSENFLMENDDETDVASIKIGQAEKITSYTSVYEKQVLEHEEDDLYKLIKFKYKDFDCFLVAIYDPTRVQAYYSSSRRKILTDIAKDSGAIVAINGGGYLWSNGRPAGLVVNNSKLLYASNSNTFKTAAINEDGVLMAGKFSKNDISKKKIKEALSFGPLLIVNGVSAKYKGTGGSGQNPRTVIAQRKDGIILFLVVNGYNQNVSWKGRGGVYYSELIEILERYGAYNAVNMDGGSSTTMVIEGKLINSPVDPQSNGQDFIRTAWILK